MLITPRIIRWLCCTSVKARLLSLSVVLGSKVTKPVLHAQIHITYEEGSGNAQQPCEHLILWNWCQSIAEHELEQSGNLTQLSPSNEGHDVSWHCAGCAANLNDRKSKPQQKNPTTIRTLPILLTFLKISPSRYHVLPEPLKTPSCCIQLSLKNQF